MKNNNDKFWLTIEPYVFIFKGKSEYILVNSLSKQLFQVNTRQTTVIELLTQLQNPDNLYTIEIRQEDLHNKDIQEFINLIHENFLGDLFSHTLFSHKPFTIPPNVHIQNNVNNIQKEIDFQKRETIMCFLHEITVYFNGNCNQNCTYCTEYHKQFVCCTQSQNQFTISDLDVLYSAIEKSYISKINILGGNILLYESLSRFLAKIEYLNVGIHLYIHYLNYDDTLIASLLFIKTFTINILVIAEDKKPINLSMFHCKNTENLIFRFIVSNENQIIDIQKIIDDLHIKNYYFYPFYHNNIDFFKQHVFSTMDDIIETGLITKNIFSKQSYNMFDYGKFIISSNKSIYTNLNYPPIGQLEEDFFNLIKQAISHTSCWFKTRDKLEICKDCAYCFLCPSPSNYETVTEKPNLCTMIT